MTKINMEKCESEKEKIQPTLRLLSSAKTIRHILFSPCMHARETRSHAGFRLAIKAGANLIFLAKIVSIVVTPLECQ